MFVDGEEILTEVPHTYKYGKHKLHVMAEGYEPQDHTLKVAEPNATLFIDLEPKEGTEDSAEDASSEEVSSGDAASDYSSVPYDYSRYNVSDGNAADTASTKEKKSSSKASSSATSGTTAGVDSEAATTVAASEDSSSGSSDGNKGSGAATTGDGSDSSSSGSTQDNSNEITGYRVTFDAPIGAEAYLDGNYVGMMPVSFVKVSGQHMVTLQKAGYETKSYTIHIDKEKTNVTYSFPELVPVKKDEGSGDDSGQGSSEQGDSGEGNSGSDSAEEGKTSEDEGTDDEPAEVTGGEP